MRQVYAPIDVVALVLEFLQSHGVECDSTIPAEQIRPGTVRVTRTGGGIINERPQDRAQVLVEVWGQNQPESFRAATHLYALFAAANDDPQTLFPAPGVDTVVYDVTPDVPLQYPDEYAGHLDRHQFTVHVTVGMEVTGVEGFNTSAD